MLRTRRSLGEEKRISEKCKETLFYLESVAESHAGGIFGSVIPRLSIVRDNSDFGTLLVQLLVPCCESKIINKYPGYPKSLYARKHNRILHAMYDVIESSGSPDDSKMVACDLSQFYNTVLLASPSKSKHPDVDVYFASQHDAKQFVTALDQIVCSKISTSSGIAYNHLHTIRFNVRYNECVFHIEVSYPMDSMGAPPSDSLSLFNFAGTDVNPVFERFFDEVDFKAMTSRLDPRGYTPHHCPLPLHLSGPQLMLVMYALDMSLCDMYYTNPVCSQSIHGIYNQDGSIRYCDDDPFIRMVQNMINRLLHILERFGPSCIHVPQFEGILPLKYVDRWSLACGHMIDGPMFRGRKVCVSVRTATDTYSPTMSLSTKCLVCHSDIILCKSIPLLTDPNNILVIHEHAMELLSATTASPSSTPISDTDPTDSDLENAIDSSDNETHEHVECKYNEY